MSQNQPKPAGLQAGNHQAEIHFIGSEKPLEAELVTARGYSHLALPVEPLPTLKRAPWRFLQRNWQAYRRAMAWLDQHRPACVIGLGGYASAPLVMAANRRVIPTLLLEQNVIPGRATRWLSKRSRGVVVSFAETCHALEGRIFELGIPVRSEIAKLTACDRMPASELKAPQLLILGGSQGAKSLNEAVLKAFSEIRGSLAGWKILHQTGAEHASYVRLEYEKLGLSAEVLPFIADMGTCYRETLLVISRAGATTLAELACAALPAVLVPFPFAADDHQKRNAEAFVQAGAARLVVQEASANGTGSRLRKELEPLLRDPQLRQNLRDQMNSLARPDATAAVISLIHQLCRESTVS